MRDTLFDKIQNYGQCQAYTNIFIFFSFDLRLYGCLRIAVGWIIFNVRLVDDGRFRRTVCEALFFCYLLQAAAVLRAQFTDRANTINWVAILVLILIGSGYGRFRFGKGGDMIKVYELPQNNKVLR